MANSCIICEKILNARQQILDCPLCMGFAHRLCTNITPDHFTKKKEKGKKIDCHWHNCLENIQHKGHLCPCGFCTERRMNSISYMCPEFPDVNNTVPDMETSQPLSPIRDPEAAPHLGVGSRGMHVSSWEAVSLNAQLDTVTGISSNQSDHSGNHRLLPSQFMNVLQIM